MPKFYCIFCQVIYCYRLSFYLSTAKKVLWSQFFLDSLYVRRDSYISWCIVNPGGKICLIIQSRVSILFSDLKRLELLTPGPSLFSELVHAYCAVSRPGTRPPSQSEILNTSSLSTWDRVLVVQSLNLILSLIWYSEEFLISELFLDHLMEHNGEHSTTQVKTTWKR